METGEGQEAQACNSWQGILRFGINMFGSNNVWDYAMKRLEKEDRQRRAAIRLARIWKNKAQKLEKRVATGIWDCWVDSKGTTLPPKDSFVVGWTSGNNRLYRWTDKWTIDGETAPAPDYWFPIPLEPSHPFWKLRDSAGAAIEEKRYLDAQAAVELMRELARPCDMGEVVRLDIMLYFLVGDEMGY